MLRPIKSGNPVGSRAPPVNLPANERERANLAPRHSERLVAMRAAWEAWDSSLPPIPADAQVSLGYIDKDMPQR